MPTFKRGDRVQYVGRTMWPCDQQQGDLGTVVWSGDIPRIGDTTLRDWVRVKWDAPATKIGPVQMRADQVKLATNK